MSTCCVAAPGRNLVANGGRTPAELGSRAVTDKATTELTGPLQALASELTARGLAAHVSTARHPCVRVVNRQASVLSEVIYAARSETDDSVWFWWSWAERICPADSPRDAADKVEHVLTPQGFVICDPDGQGQPPAGARLESSSL
jgi:hypothetical protein